MTRRRSGGRASAVALLVAICSCAWAASARGQTVPPGAEPRALAMPDTATAVPVARIPQEMAKTMDLVVGSGYRYAMRASFAAVEDPARALLLEMERREDAADSALAHSLTLRDVEALSQEWADRRDRLGRQLEEARKESRLLFQRAVALDSLHNLWRATREREGASLTSTRLAAIDSVLASIEYRQTIEIPLSEQADSLSGDLFQAGVRARRIQERIRAEEDRLHGRLFQRDAPPLWEALRTAPGERGVLDQLRDAWQSSGGDVRSYLARDRAALLGYGVLFVALVLLLVALRSQVRGDASGSESEIGAHLLRRPISVAFLLTALAFIWSRPNVPIETLDALAIAIVLPLLWFLRDLLAPPLRAPLSLLAILFVLDHLGSFLGERTLAWRFSLLARSVAGAAAALWLDRQLSRAAGRKRGLRPWFTLLLRLAAGLLVLAMLANLLGFLVLASILTEGTLNSVFLAVFFGALHPILFGVLHLVSRSPLVGRSRYLSRTAGKHLTSARIVIRIGLALAWVWIVLTIFRVDRPIAEAIGAILGAELAVGEAHLSLGGVLGFVLVVWLGVTAARVTSSFLEEDVLERIGLARGVPAAVSRVTQICLIALVFLLAAAAAGVQLSQLAILTGALGVGIGFGMQNLVNNFVSGLILMFERPIQVGDVVQVGNLTGEVRSIGFRSSTVRTYEGSFVIVPNSNLVSNEVINWTHSDPNRRIELKVGVSYETDPERVIEILQKTAASHPEVSPSPAPMAIFLGFGDSSLDFALRYWTSNFERWVLTASEVAVAVNKALAEAGLRVPYPQRTVHVAGWNPGAGSEPPAPLRPRKRDSAPQGPDGA